MSIFDWIKKQYSPDRIKRDVQTIRNIPSNFRVGMNTARRPTETRPTRIAQGALHGLYKAGQDIQNATERIGRSKAGYLFPQTLPHRLNLRSLNRNKRVTNEMASRTPQTTAGKIASFVGESAPYFAIPAAPIPKAIKYASPIKRLVGSSAIRGIETAGVDALTRFGRGESGKQIAKSVPISFGAGALFNTALSPKLLYKGIKGQNIASKMDATIPKKYSEVIQGDVKGKLFRPNVKKESIPISDFEKEITGNKVNFYKEKGYVTKLSDKETGKLISWSTDNPNFAKRVQEGKLSFGLSTREVKPSEVTPNQSKKVLSPETSIQNKPHIPKSKQAGALEYTQQSNPDIQIRKKLNQKISSYNDNIPQKKQNRQLTHNQTELKTSQQYLDNLINSEAKNLREIEEQAGVGIMKLEKEAGQGGGMDYSRFSEHSKEYRDYFKKTGHKPSLSWWKDRVKDKLEKGEGELAAEYNSIKKYISEVEAQVAKEGGRIPIVNLGKKQNIKIKVFPQKVKVRNIVSGEKNIPIKTNALNDVSPETVKDISGFDASFKTVYRNFEKAFGNKFKAVKRRVLDPFDVSKGNMIREQERLAQGLKTNIVEKLGINKGSKESALVQQFGEGKITLKQLKDRTKNWKNIVEADKWFRKEYDRLLGEVNTTRTKIYPNNPDKQISKRKDYYRHFQELSGIEGLKNVFDSPANIPTELAGVSDTTQPKSKFLSFAQKRLGIKTKEDAVGGFLDYMRSATYAKHIDQHIAKFRNLADEITEVANKSEKPELGSRFAEYLRDYANDLSGKTNALDRSAQKILGRKLFSGISWLNSRVKANVILGNLSSAVAQAGNTPQMMAKAGYRNWALGFKDTLAHNNKAIQSSSFIKERYSQSIFDKFDKKIIDQPKKLAVWITQSLDELATKIGWNGFYRKAIKEGMSNPTKYADDMARSMVGGRGVGEVPLIQKSKVTQLVAPFQLEVQNLMHILGKEVSNKEFGVLVKYALAAYGFNKAAETIRGNGVTFDPVQATVDAIKAYQEEDNKSVGLLRAGGRLGGEVFSNMMGGQTIASLYPEYGIKIGDETVTRKELFGDEDPTRFGQGVIGGGLQDPLYKIIPPFGGMQVKKTIEGTSAYNKGYSESKGGKVQFPIDKNAVNAVKSAMFGKYSSSNAREHFDKNRNVLGDNQSEIFKAGGGKEYYNQVMQKREQNKAVEDELKAIQGNKKNKPGELSKGIYQLSNGKTYSTTLDKTFDTPEEAELEVAKEDFRKSDQKTKIVQENGLPKVWIKNRNGEVSDKEYKSYVKSFYDDTAKNYKNKKDLEGWMKATDKYLSQLTEYYKLLDPEYEKELMLEIENEIFTTEGEMAKYMSYGGFTKGKKGSKAKKGPRYTTPNPTIKAPFTSSMSRPSSQVKTISLLNAPKLGGSSGRKKQGVRQLRTKRMGV